MIDNNDDNNTYYSILNDETNTPQLNNNNWFNREDYLWGIFIITITIIIIGIIVLLHFI